MCENMSEIVPQWLRLRQLNKTSNCHTDDAIYLKKQLDKQAGI